MAHEIEVVDGQARTFFVGDTPWHKLGTRFVEAPTIEQAIVAAGLNWEVGLKKLFTAEGVQVPGLATYRKSDDRILGVVGPTYHPLQNAEAFKFFQPFLDGGLAELETAGCLRNGQRVWILAKIKQDDSVIVSQADDRVAKYVLLSNSHDGTLAVRVGFTPIRVVCANTMAMAIEDKASRLIRVRHTGNVVGNLDKIRDIMNLANQQFEATAEQFRLLATKDISQLDLARYVKLVFATNVEDVTDESKSRVFPKIVQLFEHGRGNDLPGVKGTMWAAYNAITEYVQYNRGEQESTRLDQTWFGSGAQINKRALNTALTMIKLAA